MAQLDHKTRGALLCSSTVLILHCLQTGTILQQEKTSADAWPYGYMNNESHLVSQKVTTGLCFYFKALFNNGVRKPTRLNFLILFPGMDSTKKSGAAHTVNKHAQETASNLLIPSKPCLCHLLHRLSEVKMVP